jgi:hypothetical protein
MCAENQVHSSGKTHHLNPKRSRPNKAKPHIKDGKVLQVAKRQSNAEKTQIIVSLLSQIVNPIVYGLCLLSIVILKILRPDIEVYGFLCGFVILLFKSCSRTGNLK